MKPKYCECGRPIVVKIRGHFVTPKDDDHTLCRQCYESQRDSLR